MTRLEEVTKKWQDEVDELTAVLIEQGSHPKDAALEAANTVCRNRSNIVDAARLEGYRKLQADKELSRYGRQTSI